MPPWFARIMEGAESLALDNARDRDRLFALIVEGLPLDTMVSAGTVSAKYQLERHGYHLTDEEARDVVGNAVQAMLGELYPP